MIVHVTPETIRLSQVTHTPKQRKLDRLKSDSVGATNEMPTRPTDERSLVRGVAKE